MRHLEDTTDEGLIHFPDFENFLVDCCVDSDFAGLWGVQSADDPTSVKYRTGCVVLVAGCPVTWVCKLQSLIALSTLESECVALSHAMRDMTPLRHMVNEILQAFNTNIEVKCNMHSTVCEDNSGCLKLAAAQCKKTVRFLLIEQHCDPWAHTEVFLSLHAPMKNDVVWAHTVVFLSVLWAHTVVFLSPQQPIKNDAQNFC